MKINSGFISFFLILFVSCTNNEVQNNVSKSGPVDTIYSQPLRSVVDTVVRGANQHETSIANTKPGNILGVWKLTGEENSSFVIEEKEIVYPDFNSNYKYEVKGDSLKIKFQGYEGAYQIEFNGPDTLILIGDEKQVYYRTEEN